MNQQQKHEFTFADKLRPKNWEELVIAQVWITGQAISVGKQEFTNAVTVLFYYTQWLHKNDKEFQDEINSITKKTNTDLIKTNPNDRSKINNIMLTGALKKFGAIIDMLNRNGIKPVPYGKLLNEADYSG